MPETVSIPAEVKVADVISPIFKIPGLIVLITAVTNIGTIIKPPGIF
jgi:hypothetical protein